MSNDFIDNEMLRSVSNTTRVGGGGGGAGGPNSSGPSSGVGFVWMQDPMMSLNKFVAQIAGLQNRLRRADPIVQNKAAYIIAQVYRNRLRAGVGPKLSPLTQALTSVHKPLSTLADHVIVVPISSGKPAKVTFEKGWAKIAWLLENGYVLNVGDHPAIKARLFWIAQMRTGASNIDQILDMPGNGKFWIVPARPHIHFLKDRVLWKVLEDVTRHYVFGIKMSPTVSALVNRTKTASRGEFQLRDTVPI